jgi:hypothetical protein
MTTIPSLLQPLKDRLAAATPGPWTDALGKTFKAVGSIADARLIVNAPTDQAKLIAAVEAVEKARRDLFEMSTDPKLEPLARAVYRDSSRAIFTALTQALGGDTA